MLILPYSNFDSNLYKLLLEVAPDCTESLAAADIETLSLHRDYCEGLKDRAEAKGQWPRSSLVWFHTTW